MRDEPAVAGCSGGLEWRVRVVGWHVETVRVVDSKLLLVRVVEAALHSPLRSRPIYCRRFGIAGSKSLVRIR